MISGIENGMIKRWHDAMALNAVPYRLKSLDSYGGQLDDMAQAVKAFPALYVAFSGATDLKHFNDRTYWLARFSVIVAATSLRNEQESRQGHANRPGSYQIALDTIRLIGGQTFGLPIDPMKPVKFTPLANNRVARDIVSIIEIDFTTTFDISLHGSLEALSDFKLAHANWELPPFGRIVPPLPNDAAADAISDIHLPQGGYDLDPDDFSSDDFNTSPLEDFKGADFNQDFETADNPDFKKDNFNPGDFEE